MADSRAAARYSQGLSHSDDDDDGSSDGDKQRYDDDGSSEGEEQRHDDDDGSSEGDEQGHDDDDDDEEEDDDDDGSSDGAKRRHDDDDDDEEDIDGVAMDEPLPKKQKITMGFNKTFGSIKTAAMNEKKNIAPITIKLGSQKPKESKPFLQKTSASVASAFNQESDEEEEMPPEAKMRMRNIGRDTPTSAGPNSFGKTRQGFCDSKKVFERQLKEKMEEVGEK